MLRSVLLVGVGGADGSMARYGVSYLVSKIFTNPIHFAATLIINIVGSMLIGIFFGLLGRHIMSENWGLVLASGFCGGFTTFSTFALENVDLFQKGQSVMAFMYLGGSIIAGLLLCRLGIWMVS